MADKATNESVKAHVEDANAQPRIASLEIEASTNVEHIDLRWRTWLAVFVTGFFVYEPTFVSYGFDEC